MTDLDTYLCQLHVIDCLDRANSELANMRCDRIVLTDEERESLRNARRAIHNVRQALERKESETFLKLREQLNEKEEEDDD